MILQDGAGSPRLQTGGESPPLFPRVHHDHIHGGSPEWQRRTRSFIRYWSSRLSSPSPHYYQGHAWRSLNAVWAEASTPQTTSFPGRLTEVTTPEVINRLWGQVVRLTPRLTDADGREFASGNWAFSLAPSGSQPQAQSGTHGITGTICT